MGQENLIEGYRIMTGKTNGRDFGTQKLYNLWTRVLFLLQLTRLVCWERSQLDIYTGNQCPDHAQPQNVPIPLTFLYNKENLERNSGLVLAPLISTFRFFNNKVCRKSSFWRILAYIPNLDIGNGKSITKSADEKQREHHQLLTKALQEMQEVCDKGEWK